VDYEHGFPCSACAGRAWHSSTARSFWAPHSHPRVRPSYTRRQTHCKGKPCRLDNLESCQPYGYTRVARVEVALKTDILMICLARSGSSNSLNLSINSSRLLLRVGVEASGFLELTRWLVKPPKPLEMQI
jgi:hypothetical protein